MKMLETKMLETTTRCANTMLETTTRCANTMLETTTRCATTMLETTTRCANQLSKGVLAGALVQTACGSAPPIPQCREEFDSTPPADVEPVVTALADEPRITPLVVGIADVSAATPRATAEETAPGAGRWSLAATAEDLETAPRRTAPAPRPATASAAAIEAEVKATAPAAAARSAEPAAAPSADEAAAAHPRETAPRAAAPRRQPRRPDPVVRSYIEQTAGYVLGQ
jgi:hypothetical protein